MKLLRLYVVGLVKLPCMFLFICAVLPLVAVDPDMIERALDRFDAFFKRLAGGDK